MRLWRWIKSMFTTKSTPTPTTTTVPPTKGWQPEWAVYLRGFFNLHLASFAECEDIKDIRPDFFSLTRTQQVEVLVTFVRGMCYYESGFNPHSESVDVGSKGDKDTWSVGLLQMSVVDQQSYGVKLGYTYEDLKDPIKNLQLAMAIMQKIVTKKKRIILRKGKDTGIYWAVIYIGGKYDKSKDIIAGVRALTFNEAPQSPATAPIPKSQPHAPWMSWLEARIGWTEFAYDKELSKGWPLTNVPYYKTVIGTEYAWCAMVLCSALEAVGYKHSKNAAAVSFAAIGTSIDWVKNGVPRGAIVVIQHTSGSFHVSTANKDHDPGDRSLYLLGGNQDNAIRVKLYFCGGRARGQDTIYAVRWPALK